MLLMNFVHDDFTQKTYYFRCHLSEHAVSPLEDASKWVIPNELCQTARGNEQPYTAAERSTSIGLLHFAVTRSAVDWLMQDRRQYPLIRVYFKHQ